MTPEAFIRAARVPETVKEREMGPWIVRRIDVAPPQRGYVGFDTITYLHHVTLATMHIFGEVVMEDSAPELRKHLPILMAARGRVLVTGLGLGCVVRGLLASDRVEHVTVIEKCPWIVEHIGPEFYNDPRVSIRLEDALRWNATGERFDYAWHDLWTNRDAGEMHLQCLHAKLFIHYRRAAKVQGAWAFPRNSFRLYARKIPMIGGPNFTGRIRP